MKKLRRLRANGRLSISFRNIFWLMRCLISHAKSLHNYQSLDTHILLRSLVSGKFTMILNTKFKVPIIIIDSLE